MGPVTQLLSSGIAKADLFIDILYDNLFVEKLFKFIV